MKNLKLDENIFLILYRIYLNLYRFNTNLDSLLLQLDFSLKTRHTNTKSKARTLFFTLNLSIQVIRTKNPRLMFFIQLFLSETMDNYRDKLFKKILILNGMCGDLFYVKLAGNG
jgi:hypothetical protein